MAFVPGINSRYYVGPMRFSVFGKSLSADVTCAQLDSSSAEDTAITYVNGQKNGSASIDMMLDTEYATTSQFTTLNTWQTTQQPITVGFDGLAIGDTAWMLNGNQSSVSYGSPVGDLVSVNVSVQPDGPVDWGQVVDAETAITEDTNGAAVDGGASSSNGGVAHLHVTGFVDLTSNDIIIEQSANGSTSWTTVATFSSVSAVGSERVVIAPGTAVARYLRVVDDVTGTGSCTRLVTFARR